MRRRKSFFF